MELAIGIVGSLASALFVGVAYVRTLERAHKAESVNTMLVVKLASAEGKVRQLEVLNAAKQHSDPLINKWFAAALDALPPAGAQLIRDGLRAEQLHQDGAGEGPVNDPERVPSAPGPTLIEELR